MGKAQKKTGKGRLDKYYKLAKEQGYRARSAFKLIQLNKKYSFLESARCCIDLCAAPGGWLQVASKYMPINSVIVGVDLVPIKPIPRVVTFTSDITAPQCRNLIRSEIKDWKADVVLHDGAPNVGTAWVQDAYSQSELVLMSMKLAVEFLIKGGTFVTKVEATKPPSSRNVSAEIFVVCRDFLAPKHIDPKFLDPKHVFKDLSASTSAEKGASANNFSANVFQPEKKRRKRDGYEDGDYTLFRKANAADFIRNPDAISLLGSVNRISFETDEEKKWQGMDVTTPDVLSNCDDLKVLGKGDFKALIKWRTALREELGIDVKTNPAEEITETAEITEEIDDEQQIQNELERLNAEAAARSKRDRRRANENKKRTIQRMQLQMTAPLDIGLDLQDATLHNGQDDIFDLNDTKQQLRKTGGVAKLVDETGSLNGDSDGSQSAVNDDNDEAMLDSEEREREFAGLEAELDDMYDAYQERLKERDTKYRVKEARRKDKAREEWHGVKQKDTDDEDSDEEGGWEEMEEAKAKGDQDSDSDDETQDGGQVVVSQRKRRRNDDLTSIGREQKKARLAHTPGLQSSRASQVWFDQDIFAGMEPLGSDDEEEAVQDYVDDTDQDQNEQEEVDSMDEDFHVVPQEEDVNEGMWNVDDVNVDAIKQAKIKNHGLLTEEAVSLAQLLVNREKTKTQMINDGFNRYSLNSKEGLPTWFLDDEGRHYKSNIPITKEAVAALRAKQRALDARPIKKVAEAKARKKYKAVQRLEKAMRKAEGVNDASDMSEKAKAQQIEKLMSKGTSKGKKKKEIKVVVAKGAHKGLKGRPKGVKGRYQMVDSRMKKEVRAAKRREKAKKSR